jgi:hypothetical protein
MKPFSNNLAKLAALMLLLSVVIGSAVNPVLALRDASVEASVRLASVANDDFNNAYAISALPYRITVTPFDATQAADDPDVPLCNDAKGLATVWYSYTPTAKAMVHMDTIGSNYDTYMAVWTGTRGNLSLVACNDDANGTTFNSAIDIILSAGVTYYIEVAQFDGNLADVGAAIAKPVAGVSDLRTAGDITHVFRLVPVVSKVYRSYASQDGYVVESSETSGTGLFKNSTLPYVRVGDDDKKRQYRSILSFNTANIPDDAVVNYAVLKVKQSAISSTGIFTKFGKIKVDIRSPYFGTGLALESADFQSAASQVAVGMFGTKAFAGWYVASLRNVAFSSVNLTGFTQFRLYFGVDDNNNTIVDYVKLYSGNAGTASQPILTLRYYIP